METIRPRQTRRAIVAAGAALTASAAIVACGAPAAGTEGGTTQKTAAPANLNFATLYKEDPSWQLSKRQMADFEAKFPNIKVQTDWITGSTGDYLKKVQTYLAGGTQPDVLFVHYLQTGHLRRPGRAARSQHVHRSGQGLQQRRLRGRSGRPLPLQGEAGGGALVFRAPHGVVQQDAVPEGRAEEIPRSWKRKVAGPGRPSARRPRR
jgi:hypothetical protein